MRTLLRWIIRCLVALVLIVVIALFSFWIVAIMRETKINTDAAPRSGHFVHAADVDLYIQEWGPPSGPAVVFLHAAGGWSEVWHTTGEALAQSGYHAIGV